MAEIKDFARMCKHYGACDECPAYDFCYGEIRDVDKVDEFVTAWCRENLENTYMRDFLKKFPNARLRTDGIPVTCKDHVYGTKSLRCCKKGCCADCWNEVMPDA